MAQEDWSNYCTCLSGSLHPFPKPGYIRSRKQEDAILACPVEEACLGATHQFLDTSLGQEVALLNNTCKPDGSCLTYGECAEGYVRRGK